MSFKFEKTITNQESEREKFGGKSIELQQQYVKRAHEIQTKQRSEYGEKNPEFLSEMFKKQNPCVKLTKKGKKFIENSPFKHEIESEIEPIKLEKKRKRETVDENEKLIKKKKEDLRNKQFERKEKKSEKSTEIHNIDLQIEELKSRIHQIKKQENLYDNVLKNDIDDTKNEIIKIQCEQKKLKQDIKESDILIIEQIERITETCISEIN